MIILTGGAGFVGSNLLSALNARSMTDVLVVDRRGDSFRNLSDLRFSDFMQPGEFAQALGRKAFPQRIEAIFHQGACADTTCADARYMIENNFTFSKLILNFALSHKIPLVYASSAAVYGSSSAFAPSRENERPLNLYALSKLAFDNHVRSAAAKSASTVAGLRYFNVYGPRESHKGKMASMVYQLYRQLKESGRARLFVGSDGYADGEQRRDFIFVDDIVRVNLALAEGPVRCGVFNVGTGRRFTLNETIELLSKISGTPLKAKCDPPREGDIRDSQADISQAHDFLGYDPLVSFEEGLRRTFEWYRTTHVKAPAK